MLKINKSYHPGDCTSVSPKVSRAHQVLQALPVHLGQKEPGEKGDTEEELEPREIKALWDRQEREASEALWDLRG